MRQTRQVQTPRVMGVLAIVGLAVLAAGAVRGLAAEADSADALYAKARQAYQEGRRAQALTDALAAHKKAPEDVRVKYLVYLLREEAGPTGTGTSGTGTGGTSGTGTNTGGGTVALPAATGPKAVTITTEEMNTLVKEEGQKAIRQFRAIQQILQRRCADGKCHGVQGTGAKWVLALKGTTNQQMLAENFRIVSQFVNRDNPPESPLLLKPLGGKEAGHPEKTIRGKTDPIYQQLLKYIGTLRKATQKGGFWEGGAPPEIP